MNAQSKAPSSVDFECTLNQACGLIELLQSKINADALDNIHPGSCSYNQVASSGICGINDFASTVKKALIEGINNFEFHPRKVAGSDQAD